MSSWQGSQLKFALGLGGIMSFYGIVSIIVWIGGTKMHLPINYQIVTIALILLTLPFALVIAFVVSRRGKKKRAAAEAAKQPAAQAEATTPAATAQKAATPAGNYGDLSAGVEEVVQFLKSSNLGDSSNALYSLPWYIVAGAPNSGKTSLSVGSNLTFQKLPSQRESEQRVIRPTPNVDWRVANEGVFFDTAGRYQTEGADADEWAGLLEAMKKARPNRPLDGMIVVVDTDRVLKSDDHQAEEIAKIMRARLDDAIQRLKVRFPVYVVFTHADAIEGFRDSFSTSKGEDKSLVWGTTIPLEKSENAQAMFDGEYEILHDALMKRRLQRLSAPFPPVRQLRIFNFPLHFGSARRKLGAFMASLFRPNPFSENPFLRGYYFTAAPTAKAASGVKTVGSSYFTERLFKDVILRDKDLVSTFIAQRQKPPIFGWFLTLTALFITFLLLVMSVISLVTNRQMLNDAKDKGDKMLTIVKADANKDVLQKKDDETFRELSAADSLRGLLVRLDDNERKGPPFYMRFGMYSGNKIYKENLLPIYMSVIEQRFRKPTIEKITSDLKKFASSQPVVNPAQLTDAEEQNLGHNYDLLKAYLMLSGDKEYKDKGEASHLVNTLKDDWIAVSKVPADQNLVAQAQLEFWAKQVDREDNRDFPRINIDKKLVGEVREKLKSFPAWQRYYKRQITLISQQIDDKIGQTTVSAILTRAGGDTSILDGSYSVPSAYSRQGVELMKPAIQLAAQKLSEDDWVMGESGKNAIAQSTDTANIEARYYRDYADQWRNFVKGVSMKPFKTKDDAANALQILSSANSPMKLLMIDIAKNTNLSAPPDGQGLIAWLMSFFTSSQNSGGGSTPPEKEFRALFTFVGTKEQKNSAPVDKYGSEMGVLFQKFNGFTPDQIKSAAQDMAQDKDPLDIKKREGNILGLTGPFKDTSSGQELALLLQKPISNLRIFLGVQDILAKKWADEILPAGKDMASGFPFADGQGDADMTKITAYLNPVDGKFSQFYKDNLAKYFEEANGQWKVKDTADVKFTPEFVAYVNGALSLQKTMFGTGATPKFEYEFKFNPVKDSTIAVTIDGQTTDSSGTGSLKGTFPAPSGTQTGVHLALASAVSAPAAPAPSNSGASAPGKPAGGPLDQTFEGTWGLFHFVEKGNAVKQPSGEYLLTYSGGGKTVTATIKPNGGDLFDKNIFKQLKAPQTFLK
ncbi:MAG: type VI secretion system membrane subunit TssM [Acidobacteriota bacterium]